MNDYGYERLDWGLMDYTEALKRMRKRHADRVAGRVGDALICVEHPAVYTLGKQGGRELIELTDRELTGQGFAVYSVERSGTVTYHGPGQAIVYPVVDLKARRMGVRKLVEAVAAAICEVVGSYGLEAVWDDQRPGVWTGGRKIAAVGLAVPEKVSMHGLALNAETNLEHFDHIRACGLDARATSLSAELGRRVGVAEAHGKLYEALCRRLGEVENTFVPPEAAAAMGR